MPTVTVDDIIEKVKQEARDGFKGEAGEKRAEHLEEFISQMLDNYSQCLGLSKLEILSAIEAKRDYSAVNYYQAANFPMLNNDEVVIYKDQKEMLESIKLENGFRCPACGGISSNPYECNSGESMNKKKNKKASKAEEDFFGEVCNWKSYGFLGTMGKGFRFTIIEGFLENPRIDECFMPIALESQSTEERSAS